MTSRNTNSLRLRVAIALSLAAVLIVAVVALSKRALRSNTQSIPLATATTSQPVAVLPFLDLTEGMQEEEFADGMTEELIDKLSKVPGLQVPTATASFYFKGKQIPVSEIAKTLGVVYVLDGSVRKSGARVRVATRLIHPSNGFVVWSETYDRLWNDLIAIQEDIAGEVTKALIVSIKPRPADGESP